MSLSYQARIRDGCVRCQRMTLADRCYQREGLDQNRFIIFIWCWVEGKDSIHFISCQHSLYTVRTVSEQFKVNIRILLIKISKNTGKNTLLDSSEIGRRDDAGIAGCQPFSGIF